MAITNIGAYLPTMDQFITHWTAVNAEITPSALVLQGGYSLTDFTNDRSALDAAITAIVDEDNSQQMASADRDQMKRDAKLRVAQYRSMVLALLSGTPYTRTLPTVPHIGMNSSLFLKPLDDMANGWNRINTDTIPGFTGPLLLAGGYDLAAFTADLAALRAAFLACTYAEENATQSRGVRDALLPRARARMVQYRRAAVGMLPAGHALLTTIPRVNPAQGSTPAAVKLTGVWNAVRLHADLSWTASNSKKLDHYSVRTAPGPKYRKAEERVVAKVPSGTLIYSTNEGLVVSGATALFRVYVVLTTLNEKGSNTVGVTRT